MSHGVECLWADWPAPPWVRACTSRRPGGVSDGPFGSLNLAAHVGDDHRRVDENRRRLSEALHLPGQPRWLRQVHGAVVLDAGNAGPDTEADGTVTSNAGEVCAILTADCVPVFLSVVSRPRVGLLHAGWRGIAGGILEAGLRAMESDPAEILAWLGPGIAQPAYEIDDAVRIRLDTGNDDSAFIPSGRPGRWLANLHQLIRHRLRRAGVGSVGTCETCTYQAPGSWFSYRRDGRCGRMASLIWIE